MCNFPGISLLFDMTIFSFAVVFHKTLKFTKIQDPSLYFFNEKVDLDTTNRDHLVYTQNFLKN